MVIVGIDPGMKGGVAFCWNDGADRFACPMPQTRRQLFLVLLEYTQRHSHIKAVVESVHSMPGQGVSSTFKFGKGCGEILGILTALGAEIIEPTPQAWKKVVLAGTDKSKDAAIQVAENLYPDIQLIPKGCRKPNDGMADAVCLMHYGRVATP